MEQSLFKYDGCKDMLLNRNKKADFSLIEAMNELNKDEFKLLEMTLDTNPNKRATTK